jgi:hypothetical protein
MKIRLSIALATALAAAGAACDVRVNEGGVSLDVSDGGRAEAESTQTYPLAKGGHIDLDTDNGDIKLDRATGTAVEVSVLRRARGRTDDAAREFLNQQNFTIDAAPDRLTIRSVKATGPDASQRRVRNDYSIRVPVGAVVTIKDERGAVRMNDVDGTFTIRSTSGHIEGQRVTGPLDIENVNGGVVMEMAAVTGNVRIKTINGGVIMGLPTTANATIEATTINGGVHVNESLPLKPLNRDRQRLSATLGAGTGPRIELQTTNGGVILGGGEAPK